MCFLTHSQLTRYLFRTFKGELPQKISMPRASNLTCHSYHFKSKSKPFDSLRRFAAMVLMPLMSLPISAFAQSSRQENRGLELPPGSARSSREASLPSSAKPELVIQAGHTKPINAVAFVPDGRWLASGGKDDTIKIWDTSTGYVLRTLYGHSSNVNALAVSADGKYLASASGDMTDKRDFQTFRKGGVVGAIDDNTVRIWEVQTGREVRTLRGHELPVGAVAFSNDARLLTSASGDSIKVWDVTSGTELRSQKTRYDKSGMEKFDSFRGFSIFGRDKRDTHQADWQKNLKLSGSKMVVSFDGRLAAVGQPDKPVRIYDTTVGRELRELAFRAIPEAENSSVAFSPDSRLIAHAKTNEEVTVQEAITGRELYSLRTGLSKSPQRVVFSNGGRFLVTATDPGAEGVPVMLKLWDAATGQLVRELKTERSDSRVISFSQDGRAIATVAAGSKTIEITDVASGKQVQLLRAGEKEQSVGPEQVAFLNSIDPKTMAELKSRGITSIEQIIDAIESLGTVANDKFPVGDAVSFSSDGRHLISRHLLLKNVATEIWDTTTGTPVRIPENASLRDRGKPHFSPDGRFRASPVFRMKDIYTTSASDYNFLPFAGSDWEKIYDQKVQLLDGKSGAKLRELNGGKASDVGIVPAVGFSFDGGLVAMTGFEKKARVVLIYESATGRKVNRFEIAEDDQSGAVAALTISDAARLLAVAHATKIDLFEISSAKKLRTLPHAGRVTSFTFSPDARFLVALGENNDKYIWDVSSGEKLATLVSLNSAFGGRDNDWLVVTPDGLFDGSTAGWNQILWQFGNNTFDVTPAETFFNEFYYPGLLAEIMAGNKPRAPRNIAQLDRRQPKITLTTAHGDAGGKASERQLAIKIEVTEKPADKDRGVGSGARDVRLFRNGSLVKVWRGDVLKGQPSTTLETTIPVVAGENRLTAYAFNRDNVKSRDATLHITGADALRRAGTAYVLAVGINLYENPQFNLKYAVDDARGFAEEVRRQQQKLSRYQDIEIIPLSDREATKANILAALKRLAGNLEELPLNAPAALQRIKPAQPEDTIVIFYAGHGTAQGQRFYLIPHDLGYQGNRADLDALGLETILQRSISDEELERAVEDLDASNLILVIDACNSGQALEAEEKRRGPMNSKGLAQLAYEKGMYILTAAQGYQAALESSQLGHGYLTYALVEEGLKTSAADAAPKDSLISVREWLDFATERVPQMQEAKIRSREIGLEKVSPTGNGREQQKQTVAASVSGVQRPRAFYRREVEPEVLIVAKP
jgi:WD40 repeat protein/uncharacterized caspase-like protein